ncbi:hypothetical protein SDC9_149341 [bioreactor metagenome]|uniref:Uncharacterized protein n=1 Tax=bioreactor metagenome TaxID=1076179 RepID=A0A645EJD6_9ZZZZ
MIGIDGTEKQLYIFIQPAALFIFHHISITHVDLAFDLERLSHELLILFADRQPFLQVGSPVNHTLLDPVAVGSAPGAEVTEVERSFSCFREMYPAWGIIGAELAGGNHFFPAVQHPAEILGAGKEIVNFCFGVIDGDGLAVRKIRLRGYLQSVGLDAGLPPGKLYRQSFNDLLGMNTVCVGRCSAFRDHLPPVRFQHRYR